MFEAGESEAEARRRMALEAALSGSFTGSLLGGVGRVLEGAKAPGAIAKSALGAGALYGGLAGGANYIGNMLLGRPSDDDTGSPYTTRGTVGGGVGGGLLGAGMGALSASDKMRALAGKAGLAAKVPDNLLIDAFKAAARGGGRAGLLRTALLGGGLGALAGAYTGADEGMQVDVIQDELREKKRRALMEAMSDGLS
jgi:hypothetical protein